MKRITFKKAGRCSVWNLGFAVHYGMSSSFSVKITVVMYAVLYISLFVLFPFILLIQIKIFL